MFFTSKVWIVARRLGCQLTARGKPSTWFPRGKLVEQSRQDKTQKRRQKAKTEKENPPATAAAHKKSTFFALHVLLNVFLKSLPHWNTICDIFECILKLPKFNRTIC